VPQIKGSGDKKELGAIETRLKSPESSGEVLAHLFDSKTFVIMSSRQVCVRPTGSLWMPRIDLLRVAPAG
jgi:hypothetical protein